MACFYCDKSPCVCHPEMFQHSCPNCSDIKKRIMKLEKERDELCERVSKLEHLAGYCEICEGPCQDLSGLVHCELKGSK